MPPRLAVWPADPTLLEDARALSERLALPLAEDAPGATYLLTLTPERLELREAGSRAGPVYVDFREARRAARPRNEALGRAVGVRGSERPTVADATAGLGQDAFLLASLGCRITLLERSSVVAALLEDGLRRARQAEGLRDSAERLTLLVGDAKTLLPTLEPRPEVVYLDPMYPERGKSALKRKEMRFFRALVGDDSDAGELLELALKVATKRVVVKRPSKGERLAGRKPHGVLPGKTVRFDLYFP